MKGSRFRINVTEIPYQVNKTALIERIAELVRDERIDGISDLRDESDRHGMSLIIETQARRAAQDGAESTAQIHAAANARSGRRCWRWSTGSRVCCR